MIEDRIKQLKALPPLQQQVCATCQFYERESYMYGSLCHAAGGKYAVLAWPTCLGKMWQPKIPKISKWQRLKTWLKRIFS